MWRKVMKVMNSLSIFSISLIHLFSFSHPHLMKHQAIAIKIVKNSIVLSADSLPRSNVKKPFSDGQQGSTISLYIFFPKIVLQVLKHLGME